MLLNAININRSMLKKNNLERYYHSMALFWQVLKLLTIDN